MILRSLIFFSLSLLPLEAAVVRGHVSLIENIRGKSRNIKPADTVVWLEALSAQRPEWQSSKPMRVTIVQKNKSFSPHVLAIPVGSTVDFPNQDPIFHNAFSNYDGQIFDIGLYPPGTSRSVKFSRAGIVRIFCNIHASMSAVIIVLATPFFATTSGDGSFAIEGVPDGKYKLSLYNEHADEKTLAAQSRVIDVAAGHEDVGSITLMGSAFLTIPHLNKYGKDYPPAAAIGSYPGARQ